MFPSDTAVNGEENEHFVFVEGATLSLFSYLYGALRVEILFTQCGLSERV